jgi:hypothetical protein
MADTVAGAIRLLTEVARLTRERDAALRRVDGLKGMAEALSEIASWECAHPEAMLGSECGCAACYARREVRSDG